MYGGCPSAVQRCGHPSQGRARLVQCRPTSPSRNAMHESMTGNNRRRALHATPFGCRWCVLPDSLPHAGRQWTMHSPSHADRQATMHWPWLSHAGRQATMHWQHVACENAHPEQHTLPCANLRQHTGCLARCKTGWLPPPTWCVHVSLMQAALHFLVVEKQIANDPSRTPESLSKNRLHGILHSIAGSHRRRQKRWRPSGLCTRTN